MKAAAVQSLNQMLPQFPLLSLFNDPEDCVESLEQFLRSVIEHGQRELIEEEKEGKKETEDKKDTPRKRGHERKRSRRVNLHNKYVAQVTQTILDATEALMGLVITRGTTLGILSAVSMLMDSQSNMYHYPCVLPYLKQLANWKLNLELSCLATLQGVWNVIWSEKNPLANSTTQQVASMASDGTYLYIHGKCGMIKVGTGHNSTVRGQVYLHNESWFPHERSSLVCVEDKLYYRSPSTTPASIVVLSCSQLKVRFFFNVY